MEHFYHWLKQNKYSGNTISGHLGNVKLIATWAQEAGYANIEQLRYQDILSYVQYVKGQSLAIPTINNRLQSLKKYYEYLKEEGVIEKNPVSRIHIKGAVKKVIKNPLSYKELETLYTQYLKYVDQNPGVHIKQQRARQRNTVLLGLLIWQGLHSGDLEKLKPEHVDLNAGAIHVPSTRRSNSRELELASHQVIPLHKYLAEVRPRQKPKADELFPGHIKDITSSLMEELKRVNEKIISAHQIRASVIMHWLRLYDKRQVQYMTGHKYISSVEKYEQQDIESLTGQLKKHHPFG